MEQRWAAIALLDDVMKGRNLTTALMVGVGALIVWPLISPIARSLTKSIIKGGVLAYRQTEQLYLGVAEGIGEILAEAQQEVGATTPARADGSRSHAT